MLLKNYFFSKKALLSMFRISSFLMILLLFCFEAAFAAKTTLNVGDNHTYGELNLKFISSAHNVDFYSGVGTMGSMNITDISGVTGVQQRWDVTHRVDIGGGSHSHPEVLRFAYSFNSYGVSVNPGLASNYVLMYRTYGTTGNWTDAGSSATVVNNDTVVFVLNIMCGYNLEFAIATKDTLQSPLPVTWLFANAKVDGTRNIINWATATEINNDRFEIERTLNGKDFERIGTVKGANNSNQILEYQFIDNKPEKNCVYRIKQIDYSGVFEYSPIVIPKSATELEGKPKMVIYPNPSVSGKIVMVDLKNMGMIENGIQVSDIYGKVVYEATFDQSDNLLKLENLPTGFYTVTVYNRYSTLNKKLMVKN